MGMIWADFNNSFLSAAQQAKMAEFEALGNTLRAGGTGVPIGALTLSQAKQARAKIEECHALMANALRGVQYVVSVKQQQALADLDAANP
jgi:hypothetical protein